MKIILSKKDAIEILTDLFFNLINEDLKLGQGKIAVGIEMEDDE